MKRREETNFHLVVSRFEETQSELKRGEKVASLLSSPLSVAEGGNTKKEEEKWISKGLGGD